MMSQVVRDTPEYWPLDIVVPVPAESGGPDPARFSQSELLAKRIARCPGSGLDPRCWSGSKTLHRRELSGDAGEEPHACTAQKTGTGQGKSVLLVDDVYTTGSTARCTRTLLDAGAKRVSVIAWASGKGL